jgi:hypothetical protein
MTSFFTSRRAALEENERSRGVLDNSQSYLDSINAVPYQTPRVNSDGSVNQNDLYRMQSTMLPVEGQPGMFQLPERVSAIKDIEQAQRIAAMQQEKFKRQQTTLGDVFAEVGNTLAAPLSFLGGGSMKPFGDPSEEQLSRSQRAMLAASNTSREAFNELRDARITRSGAIAGALAKPVGAPFKGDDGRMKVIVKDENGSFRAVSPEGAAYANDVITYEGIPFQLTQNQNGETGATKVLTDQQAQNAGTQTGLTQAATEEVKTDAAAISSAPEAIQSFGIEIAEVDALIEQSKGFVGANNMNPQQYLAGTDHYNFKANLEKVRGGAFMRSFQGLKGGGPITDKEGDAGLASLQMMDPGQSYEQFIKNAQEYRKVLVRGLDKATQDAQRNPGELEIFQRREEVRNLRNDLNMPGASK